MLKKNKLPIFLLAVVLMLSIFYIVQSRDGETEKVGSENNNYAETSSKYVKYAEARLDLLEDRTKEINELEDQIASGKLSSTEVEAKVLEINALTDAKYKEIALEQDIISLGYTDVFVVIDDMSISIDLLTEEFSTEDFVTIAVLAKEKTNSDYSVNIVTTSPIA